MKISIESLLGEDTMVVVKDRAANFDMPQPSMALSAVIVIEAIHEDGQKYLHILRPDDTPMWTAAGMAAYAAHAWTEGCDG